MGRILAWTAASAIALAPLAGCASPGVAAPLGSGAGAGPCAPLEDDGIDYARVPANPRALDEAVSRARADYAQLRSAAGLPDGPVAGDTVRVLSWGGMLPGRTGITATRNAAGGWDVEKVTDMARQPGKDQPAEAPRLSRGTLTGAEARRLTALVADQCLYREPTYFDRMTPTTDGGEAMCMDGADAVVEISAGGRRHASFHACHAYGRVAEVVAPLWQATE